MKAQELRCLFFLLLSACAAQPFGPSTSSHLWSRSGAVPALSLDETRWSQLPEEARVTDEVELLPQRIDLRPYGTLLSHNNPALPRIAFEVSFDTGASDAAPGVAELYANLLTTPQSDDFTVTVGDYLRGIGTNLAMSCQVERCSITGSCLTISFEATMTAVARLLSREEYTVNFQFRREMLADGWSGRSGRAVAWQGAIERALPAGHAYRSAIEATPEQMRAVTEDQLFAFQQTLRQSKRTVAFAGAIRPEAAKAGALALLSQFGPEKARRARPGAFEQPLASITILHRPAATSAWVAAAFVGPGAATPMGYTFRTLLPVLDKRATQHAREAHGDSYSAVVGLLPWSGAQICWFEAEALTERVGPTIQSLQKALGDLRAEGASSLGWALAAGRRSRLAAAQTSSTRVSVGMGLELEQLPRATISTEATAEVIERYVRAEHTVFVVLGNADTIKASLAAAGVDLPITVER